MILGEADAATGSSHAPSLTLDSIFHRHARRRPEALALVDPINRAAFTCGHPLRLSYAEADRIVGAIATRLHDMGLPMDTVVGIQLPNIVENLLATLAVMRAGMIVAALPLLCRRADAGAALARVGAKAVITCDRIGSFDHAELAMNVAADVFSIRYVCGFGEDLPDGVVSFSDLFAPANTGSPPSDHDAARSNAAHVAAITFDIGEGGIVPIARTHAELLAAGLAVLLEGGIAQDATIQSTINPSSFAGMSLTLVPWLLCGGTLVLRHPFDAPALTEQMRAEKSDALVLPGTVACRLAAAGFFNEAPPATVVAAWRAPERLATSAVWRARDVACIDVTIFSEIGLVPARRDADGRPGAIPLGPLRVPHGADAGTAVAEICRTDTGTLALRGAMVPQYPFPPGIEASGLPYFRIGERGLVDTGYACRFDGGGRAVVVTGAPAAMVDVGAYRFPLSELREIVGRVDRTATILPLPHAVIGQRLVGLSADPKGMRAALFAGGVNPLIAMAFDSEAA
jgi:acyl-CoA synthetase (AMP-forming)/AMP-acid ligase II